MRISSKHNFYLPAVCCLLLAGLFDMPMLSRAAAKVKPLPVVIEVTSSVGRQPDVRLLAPVQQSGAIPAGSIYQWHNHLAIFGFIHQPKMLKARLEKLFPQCIIKIYQHPYYDFNRAQRCSNTGLTRQWDNILLTANLVSNPKMQQEYLAYHATQFTKWPGVSEGFCNADFQQVLGFKIGRQLMLVISIPKGKSLDELNPKTTENNPQMVKWNALMKKYQVGLPGTKPGEVWVFFKQLRDI
jgi:hypothetical protein